MKTNLLLILTALIAFILPRPGGLYAQIDESSVEKLIHEKYSPGEPGPAVLIAKEGRIIYQKAFGMANLELGVALKPEMVFEIGSITKQFTAVAVLMLEERGQLGLDDEITRFIPDYPTQGQRITIRHLLTHTSGIKSYTSMPEWVPLWRNDYTPQEMIAIFKDQPMDFAPGEEYRYNNSGYILLGYVIEKASGLSYEDFIIQNIFVPAGMNNSFYGSHTRIIPNRVSGYQAGAEGFANAEYLSLTQPYAAGSIMTTVGDLYKWQQALNDGILISRESLIKAQTSFILNDGTPTNYGFGWEINEVNGSPSLEHGGGIFGFTSYGIWLPREKTYVVMLTNRDDDGPDAICVKLAALAIGKPFITREAQDMPADDILRTYIGSYVFDDGSTRTINLGDGTFYSQRKGGQRVRLLPSGKDSFSYEGSFSEITFNSGPEGKMEAIFKNRIKETRGVRTDEVSPAPVAIELDPALMKPFTGIYEIAPGFSLTITLEDGKLMAQATGQDKFELFPESPVKFFLTVVDAKIEFFRSDSEEVEYLILYQGGQEIKALKAKE